MVVKTSIHGLYIYQATLVNQVDDISADRTVDFSLMQNHLPILIHGSYIYAILC